MITLEPTADGSNTLYVPELNEHYHSVKGALTESAHIFIQMGLNHAQAANPRVLEIGFVQIHSVKICNFKFTSE